MGDHEDLNELEPSFLKGTTFGLTAQFAVIEERLQQKLTFKYLELKKSYEQNRIGRVFEIYYFLCLNCVSDEKFK
ncbi:hypothetical protein ACTXT7_006653 [Hymenolepis weldensis]